MTSLHKLTRFVTQQLSANSVSFQSLSSSSAVSTSPLLSLFNLCSSSRQQTAVTASRSIFHDHHRNLNLRQNISRLPVQGNKQSRRLIARNTMSSDKPKVVFVLGAPGSGKGTQCSRIVDTFGYTHLSAGDLLREERARSGSQFGTLIEEYIVNGKIVPVEITCSLLENAMIKTKTETGKNSFLIDGFPRNQDNLDGWNKQMADKVQLQFVLFFDGPTEVFLDRCLKRGAAGSGRSDDNVESLKKRLVTFETETKPIVDHYAKQSLVRSIDATESVEEVFNRVKKCFEDAANGS